MKPSVRTIIHILLIILIGIIIYLPAFNASFHLDDTNRIRDNAAIRHVSDIKAIMNYWPTRFLTYLTLAVNFHFSGLSPFQYHFTNILIHIFNAAVIYFLFKRLFAGSTVIPLTASLLFLSHPIQTQAVTYVIQRATSLASSFYLLSILFYLRFRRGPAGIKTSTVDYILALIFCICAMLTKEFTITIPAMLALLEFLALKSKKTKTSRRIAYLSPFLLAVTIIPLTVILNSGNPNYNDSGQVEWLRENRVVETVAPGHGKSPLRYLTTQPRVLITYLRLLVFPVNQRVEYDYPLFSSFAETPAIMSMLAIAAIMAIGWFARKNHPLASLGIFWFFIALLPESSVIPIIDPIVEHRLYLPMVGAIILFSAGLADMPRFRAPLLAVAALAIVCFCGFTYSRNLVWRDQVTLWEDNVAKAEGKARVHGNLGKAYLDTGEHEKAAREFKRMIELDPTFAGAYNNLAVIYIDHLKDYREAEKYITASLELFPDYPPGYVNRGVIFMNTRRLRPAVENFEKALDLDPKNLLAHYNLAACYINMGDMDRAEEHLRKGLSFWPEEQRFYLLMARVYRRRGEHGQAEIYLKRSGSTRQSPK